MYPSKYVAYFGEDKDFYKEICDFIHANGVGDFKQEISSYQKGKLVNSLVLSNAKVFIIDFTTLKDEEDLINEVIYIKRNEVFKDSLFVAVLENTDSLNERKTLFTAGFQLFHIKGNELNTTLRDSFYIAFNDGLDFPAFAKARKIDQPIIAGACSTISSCDNTHFYLESDLEILEDSLSLKLPLFPQLTAEKFNVKTHGHIPMTFPMMMGYCLEFPVAGPWSDITTDLIQEDTLETWRSLNADLLKDKPTRIKIFSQNQDVFSNIYSVYDPDLFHLEFFDDINFTDLAEDLLINETELIFFDLPIEGESSKNLEKLGELIKIAESLPCVKPIIVSTSNPSKTQAIQKLFQYSSIVCTEKPLSKDIYIALGSNYRSKRKLQESPRFQFTATTQSRAVDINFEVTLTSLTEHEITFYSQIDLPMFTLLHFKLPIDLIATVIPPTIDLPNRAESKQYMAFINGLDEKSSAALRKFVNQIIYKPLENYQAETIARAHSIMSSEQVRYDLNRSEMPANRFERTEKEYITPVKFEKRFTGKSKL